MNRNIMIMLALTVLFSVGGPAAVRAETIRKTDGTELKGLRIKWFETRREYQIENSDGSMIPVPLDDVDSLEVAKPAQFDQAEKAVMGKQYEAAIPLLEGIVTSYKRLQWDAKARELLAKAYFAKGDFKKAAQVMTDLMQGTVKSQITDENYNMYWTALMGAQMTAVLKKEINDALAGGSRTLAALAMIKRGDLFKADGKREDAVLDYLRAIILYDDARDVHPEALYKAAQLLDEMRDPRAEELKKKLMSLYPDSAYVRKLGGQM